MPQQTDNAEFRVRFVIDEDARFEECNGEARPLTEEEYKGNEYHEDNKPITYAEYRRYYGDPDRHVYLRSEVEKKCPCCSSWNYETGTGSIDLMDDDPALRHLDEWLTPEDAAKLPGYLKEIAEEDINEARG